MAKKYIPSGYQIINIDTAVEEDSSAEEKTASTEDEKLLCNLLYYQKVTKPIIINIKVHVKDLDENIHIIQCANYVSGSLLLGDVSHSIASGIEISASDSTHYEIKCTFA